MKFIDIFNHKNNFFIGKNLYWKPSQWASLGIPMCNVLTYIYEIYKGREMLRYYVQADTLLIICYCQIFEFGFTEFIHCWLINTENYDNGLSLKLLIISTSCYFVVPWRFRLFKVFTTSLLTIATLDATKGSCQAK